MLENLITNSDPQIVHAPGFDKAKPKIWWKILERYEKLKPSDKVDCNIITFNNQKKGLCEKSLDIKKLTYSVLGTEIKVWNNLYKFSLSRDFCKNKKKEICIGLDSFDVVFIGSLTECVKRFLKTNKKLIYNAELNFYPNCNDEYFQYYKQFQYEKNKKYYFKYLNSGAWIGYSDFCEFFFNECSKIELWKTNNINFPLIKNSEQSVLHSMYKKYENYVDIDKECKIFQNLAHIKNEVWLPIMY